MRDEQYLNHDQDHGIHGPGEAYRPIRSQRGPIQRGRGLFVCEQGRYGSRFRCENLVAARPPRSASENGRIWTEEGGATVSLELFGETPASSVRTCVCKAELGHSYSPVAWRER